VGRNYDEVFQQCRIVDTAKRGCGCGVTFASNHEPVVPSSVMQWRLRPFKITQSFAPRSFVLGAQTRDLRLACDHFSEVLPPSFSVCWMRVQE
jgi:hypothetical protein